MRNEADIQKLADKAADEENNPTKNRSGMNYEAGVRAALDWVLNPEEELDPLD